MTRAQKQLIVLAGLGIVMVAVYANLFRAKPPRLATAVPPAETPHMSTSEETLEVAVLSTQRPAQRVQAVQLSWARDPFTRGTGGSTVSGLVLSGILWDTTDPIAIINGEPLQVGAQVEGYRVVNIAPEQVSVTDGTHTYELLIAP